MPIPNNPNSEVDNTIPTAPTGSVSSIRMNFIRMANEIRLLQADITARAAARGPTGSTGVQGPSGTDAARGATGVTGVTGPTGNTGVKGPGGGGGGGGNVVTAITAPHSTGTAADLPAAAGYPPGTLAATYSAVAITRIYVRGSGGGWLTLHP